MGPNKVKTEVKLIKQEELKKVPTNAKSNSSNFKSDNRTYISDSNGYNASQSSKVPDKKDSKTNNSSLSDSTKNKDP